MEFTVSRRKISLYWVVSSLLVALVVSTISMLYWNYNYVPEPDFNWRPIDDYFGMITSLPFGFLLSIGLPWGWTSLAGVALSLWLQDVRPLLISIISCVVFGVYWPKSFVAMMGI